MSNKTTSLFYDRRDGTMSSAITANFNDTKLDFGFNASHVMIEVVGAGTVDIGFGLAEVHAELSDTISPATNPRVYENIGVGKIYLRGSSTDVKITAWSNGRS